MNGRSAILTTVLAALSPLATASSPAQTVPADSSSATLAAREAVAKLISEIRRADYAGDVEALGKHYRELEPFEENQALAARVHYWRGFAVWRRALNTMNEPQADRTALIRDLDLAVAQFRLAFEKDPAFADAKIAAAGCLMSLAYFYRKDPERFQAVVNQFVPLMQEAYKAEPENPRVLWIVGGNRWWTPPEHGGSQARALEFYRQGLESARAQPGGTSDPLEPSWGEPELLMSLAWSHLNGDTPDLDAAESYARAALKIVPYWHYVRDILLPQILEAKAKQPQP